ATVRPNVLVSAISRTSDDDVIASQSKAILGPRGWLSAATGDHCDRSAALGPLVLGAARDKQIGATDDSCEHTANERARMPAGLDVAVVPHNVARPADHPAARCLGFGKHRSNPWDRRFLQLAGEGEIQPT